MGFTPLVMHHNYHPSPYFTESLVVNEGAVSASMVSDSVAGFSLVVGDGGMRLAHLKLRNFNALCSSRFPGCVCVCKEDSFENFPSIT